MQMAFSNIRDFIHMGGYARFVWLAYGVSMGLGFVLGVRALRQLKRAVKYKVIIDENNR